MAVAASAAEEKGEDPSVGQSAAVRAGYLRLRSQFLAGLPQRWLEIRQASSPLSLRSALHKLCGAAGSYGFARLSDAARRAESLCIEDGLEPDDADAGSALSEALSQLRMAMKDAGVTLP